MKRYRAVVEISVPDKVDFNERQFAKLLRRNGIDNYPISMKPHEHTTRQITVKEFSRVVQYAPDGSRIKAVRPPSSFERLVLFGLWLIFASVTRPKDRRHKSIQQWLDEIKATVEASEQ